MEKNYTTVLFVGSEGEKPFSLQIPSKFIKKKEAIIKGSIAALSGLVIITLALLVGLVFVINKNSGLNEQITVMQNDLKLMDSLHIKNKVNNIEEKIHKIDNFLEEKGINNESEPIGGEVNENRGFDFRVYDFYEYHTSKLIHDIQNIPLGLPYIGEESSPYGYRSNPFGGRSTEFHSGMDFKGNIGDPIKATADGTVTLADWKGGYGRAVVIQHDYGYETVYGHLSGFNVLSGQKVKAGDIIGFLGSTGRSTGPHIHYEIRRYGTDIDPKDYINLK
ncbi:MAG: M23 family metallopeptidase [Ignavibacteriae bacterium]|nr:M23 family metallopeptidase [Ignavibacteriota bacterium]